MLAARLNTLHNLTYYQNLMKRIRASIEDGTFTAFRNAFLASAEANQ
jgi:queuine tRNA-ribosyltransferase